MMDLMDRTTGALFYFKMYLGYILRVLNLFGLVLTYVNM